MSAVCPLCRPDPLFTALAIDPAGKVHPLDKWCHRIGCTPYVPPAAPPEGTEPP